MSWKRDIGDDDHEEESVSLGSSWGNQQNVKPSTSIERIILINIIKGHSKSSLGMWKIQDHVFPSLTMSITPILKSISSLGTRLFCSQHPVAIDIYYGEGCGS